MRKYLKISLLSSSLLLLGVVALGQSILTLDAFGEGVYNMQIDRKKDHFSGILSVAEESKGVYRFALVSKMGGTLIDMRISEQPHAKNTAHPPSGKTIEPSDLIYCVEPLNKKAILKLLERDFRLLIWKKTKSMTPGKKVIISGKKFRIWSNPCIRSGVQTWKTAFSVTYTENCDLIEAKINHPAIRLHLTIAPMEH